MKISNVNNSKNIPLSIRNINKRFGHLWANKNISFDVETGKVIGLLGPNGAGKTTLIRICAGWLKPEKGEVIINGEKQSVSNLKTRLRLGVVSRDAALHGELTVTETLSLYASLYGLTGTDKKAACEEVISDYYLHEFVNKRIDTLSTGMFQRVAIARAMLHKPSVLLLDEPTVGLDPEVRKHIWDCLKNLKEQGVAMLFTTHYLEEAATLCDKIHLMVDAKVVLSVDSGSMDGSVKILEREYMKVVENETYAERII